jgi:hypothetical protein
MAVHRPHPLAPWCEKESERLEHGSVDANADSRVSSFDTLNSWAATKGSFGDNGNRASPDSSPTPHNGLSRRRRARTEHLSP